MKLTEDELRHIERLARVSLSGESREKLKAQLADIVRFVQKLQAVDTSGIARPATAGGSRLRDDTPEDCLQRDEVLEEAPEQEEGFFKVPAVIEGS
jgi:aspartyl-tRNA(Asn)/glutamyl-tRNA(Gln) amidotransferase subunit C